MNKNNPFQLPIGAAAASIASSPLANFFSRHHKPVSRAELPAVIRAVLEQPVEYYQALSKQAAAAGEKPLTNVAFILDASSSMLTGKSTTIDGFNAQVKVVREGSKEAGETTFTETHFSDQVTVRRVASSLDHLANLTDETYKPDGMTALYDALGDTLAALLQTPRMSNASTATLVTLFTDGAENSSVRYDAEILASLIKRLEATGRWTFALVGPRNGVSKLADLLAVKKDNIQGYDPASVAERTQAFGIMASASASYMSLRSMGVTQANSLYADVHKGADLPQ